MKILSIELENYGAFYGKHPPFRFHGRGLTMILGDNRDEPRMDSNGAAKSTVPDALDWCLFGVVPKDDHADSVINDEAGERCQVVVHLEDDNGAPVRVQRSRKYPGVPRNLQVWYAGNEITTLDDKETQAQLERILGMDRDVFHAAVYYAQTDNFNLADAKDSEAMEILTKVMGLGPIDTWLERAKQKRAAVEAEIQRLQTEQTRLEGESAALALVDFKAQAVDWEQQRSVRIAQATQRLTEAQGYLAQAEAQLVNEPLLKAKWETLTRSPVVVPALTVDPQTQAVLVATQTDAQMWARNVSNAETKLRALNGKQEGPCSACGQPVTGEHLAKERAAAQEELHIAMHHSDNAGRMVATVQHAIREQQAQQQAAIADAQQRAAQYNHEMAELRQALANMSNMRSYADQTRAALTRLQTEIAGIQAEVNPFYAKETELAHRRSQLTHDLADLDQALHATRAEADHWDFWVQGFSAKGLKNYILDTRLQELSDAANEWVRMLTGGTIWVRFETQTLGRSTGRLSNKLNVRVFRYNRDGSTTERNYRSWSGGEKKRVAFGIAFGLSRLFARRATKSYDAIVLDEVFKYVDRSGRVAVMEMLRALAKEKSTVLVIEHDADFQGAFEHRLLVRKENRRSTIMEIDSGKEAKTEAEAAEEKTGEGHQHQQQAVASGAPSGDGVRADTDLPGRRRPAKQQGARSRRVASPGR